MCDSTDLSELSREELYSIINKQKEKICFLETQLNQNKNESKKGQPNKRLKSSGSEALDRQTVNKKSFSDRICDDLCEEILQYLSLEDKLKLEGVSKQFQRTVLKKHKELFIGKNKSTTIRKSKEKYKYFLIENISIGLKYIYWSLEVLLKKCPNITSIELRDSFGRYGYYELFRLITKYCNNLREIVFGENEMNDINFQEFQRKFGPKINFIHRLKDANNYNLFPNIEKLIFKSELLYQSNKQLIPRLKLNKLKKLEVIILEEHMVKTCVDTFPTLTHLNIEFRPPNTELIVNSLKFISNLKHLIHLSFKSFGEINEIICVSLKRMANKCQKLKSFECDFNITDNLDIRQLLSPFEAFPALKRLCLTINCQDLEDFDINDFISFEAFKGLSNITHLTLRFDESYYEIEANILTDIDIHLPKLQYLELKEIKVTPEEVTQMADILSRLSRLQTLKLTFSEGIDCDEFEEKIREKCRKIGTIHLTEFDWE